MRGNKGTPTPPFPLEMENEFPKGRKKFSVKLIENNDTSSTRRYEKRIFLQRF